MGLLDLFKKKPKGKALPVQQAGPSLKMPTPVSADADVVETILQVFRDECSEPCVKLVPCYGEPVGPIGSKFGGRPFLPHGFTQPTGFDGEPMRLLAQLNFEQLPKLPGFPAKGLLQFYLACDDTFGAFYKEGGNPQGHYRVVYHPEVDEARGMLSEAEISAQEMFPLQGEIPVKGELLRQPMNSTDYRFGDAFLEVYRRYLDTDAKGVWQLDKSVTDVVFDRFCASGHRMGGTPYFTQEDPRQFQEKPYDTLLFQMDSDGPRDGTWEILWGDVGVANFFITAQALANLDFSDVMYTWDCY